MKNLSVVIVEPIKGNWNTANYLHTTAGKIPKKDIARWETLGRANGQNQE